MATDAGGGSPSDSPSDAPFNIDADPRNADWIKTPHWDLPIDADEFLAVIGGPEQLPNFMTLPAAEPMPEALRAELKERGLLEHPDQRESGPEPRSTLYILGGGPGAGKKGLLQADVISIPDDAIYVDPDRMKAELPEFAQLMAAGNPQAAMIVHAESADIAKVTDEGDNVYHPQGSRPAGGLGSLEGIGRAIWRR